MSSPSRAEIARFNRQTKFGNSDENCLLWAGRKDSSGYGRFDLDSGVSIAVHRFVYQIMHGEVLPDDMQVDHVCHTLAVQRGTCEGGDDCRHRLCCNPQHLEFVTASENTIRQNHAGRRKTHCPKGHEYTPENTRVGNGKRYCRQCDRERDRSARVR